MGCWWPRRYFFQQPCSITFFFSKIVLLHAGIKKLIHHYYQNTQGLIYIVDSADRERIQESGDELRKACSYDELQNVPVLILANKQDLANKMSIAEIIDGLKLNLLKQKWNILPCTATHKDGPVGVREGLSWIADNLK